MCVQVMEPQSLAFYLHVCWWELPVCVCHARADDAGRAYTHHTPRNVLLAGW